MRFAPTAEQVGLASAVHDLLTDACPPAVVRAAWDGVVARDLWQALADLGLLGARVNGLTEVDLVGAFVEIGRFAVPLPVAETAAVLVPLLAEAVGEFAEPLEGLTSGRLMGTAELSGAAHLPWGGFADYALLRHGSDLHLADLPPSVKTYRAYSGHSSSRSAPPAEREALATIDGSRAAVRALAPGSGVPIAGGVAVERAWLRGALAASAQLVGLAQRQLDLTVAYVRERRQFGAPVGSQQAIKHLLANALVELRFTLPVVQRAAVCLAAGSPDAGLHVAAAKAMASTMAAGVARAALQAHGAIGYTVEYDLHLYLKRSWALAAGWGTAAHHRAVIADALSLEVSS
jgi:alkylation response protein AidB-like acyl-CoA dehydrogenase